MANTRSGKHNGLFNPKSEDYLTGSSAGFTESLVRRSSRDRIVLGVLAIMACFAQVMSAESAFFWTSGPVQPGKTVLLTGYFPKPETVSLKVRDLTHLQGDWQAAVSSVGVTVKPVMATERTVAFALPGGPEGVYAFRLDEAGESPLYGRVNLPEIWWTLADSPMGSAAASAEIEADSASPGAKLRLFGRCLANGAQKPQVELTSSAGRIVVLSSTVESAYALTVNIPDDIPPGTYRLRLLALSGNSGSASSSREIKIHAAKPVSLKTVSVTSFGAIGNGKFDNSGAFAAAMARATTLGGAEVRIPAGAYLLSKPLDIPVGVYLAGESADVTELAFPDIESPPDVWIKGTQYFGLRDLAVYCGNHKTIISSDMTGLPDKSGHVHIRNVRVVGSVLRGHPTAEESGRKVALLVQGSAKGFETLRLSGPDIDVEGSYLLGSGRSLYLFNANGVVVRRNKLLNGIVGWYDFDGSANIVNENNVIEGADLLSAGGAYSTYSTVKRSANIYTANNTYSQILGVDREAVSSDGPGGAYYGPIQQIEGTHLTLKDHAEWWGSNWHDAVVVIIDGRGAGQWRTITNWGESGIDLSAPFDITPDATSIITVVAAHLHYIFFRNHFQETGLAIQFYGTAIEHIVAENDETHAGGYYVVAKNYKGGVQPALNLQLIQNQVHSGMNYHYGPNSGYAAGPSFLEALSTQNSAIIGLAVINNVISDQAVIRIKKNVPSVMTGILLEGNVLSNPSRGIQVDKSAAAEVIIQ